MIGYNFWVLFINVVCCNILFDKLFFFEMLILYKVNKIVKFDFKDYV